MQDSKFKKLEDLKKLCDNFDTDCCGDFYKIMKSFVDIDSDNVKKFRNHLRTALGTISRWANGYSKPHPAVQKVIIDFILDYIKIEIESHKKH